MFNVELTSERIARERLEKRHKRESERQERVFNEKVRTIGVDVKALDMQLKEKKALEEAARTEEAACDAEDRRYNFEACVHQNRQKKKSREMEKALVNYRHQHQMPSTRREFDLNDPDYYRKLDPGEAQMMLPGLVGEEQDSESRLKRQKEQLREWLLCQQEEHEEEQLRQKMEGRQYEQSRKEMHSLAVELHKLEMNRRKATAVAVSDYNLAAAEAKQIQDKEDNKEYEGSQQHALDMVPGMCPSKDRREPPESLQQVIQFHKHQIEEKKRTELEQKQEGDLYHQIRLDSVHSALLMERQQKRISKQLRRIQDSTNAQLAQTRRQQKPDIERGCIEDSFFSKFTTCSR
uniref:RIB43A domain with coiled-coils 2 n=2 Tax=Nothobranchius korthausae TaxID=1143690 RepID=A0A1A8F2H2_9TELE